MATKLFVIMLVKVTDAMIITIPWMVTKVGVVEWLCQISFDVVQSVIHFKLFTVSYRNLLHSAHFDHCWHYSIKSFTLIVPVPHFGAALQLDEFHEISERLKDAGVNFIIEPHRRFEGQPGDQWTMFFKDPSGNNLEFKSMMKPENLFARYDINDI